MAHYSEVTLHDFQEVLTPANVRSVQVIYIALFLGILAFIGLVICLLASQTGVLQAYPIYWLNTLSSLIFIGYVFSSLPTKERLVKVLREKQSGSLGS